MQVKLSYNAFCDDMSVYVDDRPVAKVSRLARCMMQPFAVWCREICSLIYDEVNGHYDLLYTGRSCEARLLGQLARTFPYCSSFEVVPPVLPDTALLRLKKLSSYVQSGLSCGRMNAEVHIYTDIPDNEAFCSMLRESMPKFAFCRVHVSVHALSDFRAHPAAEPAYIILALGTAAESLEIASLRTDKGVILHADGRQAALTIRDGFFEEHFSPQNCIFMLGSYLELWTLTDILRKALQSVSVNENSPMYLRVQALDKLEPVTQVVLPSSIEYGETATVRVYTIPEGAEPEDIHYRISDTSVISFSGGKLKAEGVGEAVVEAYVSGKNSPAAAKKILCYSRNRIQTLILNAERVDLLEGSEVRLTFSYSPDDADDVDSIRLSSSNALVATVGGKYTIKARRAGHCVIYANAEKASASCKVNVYPRLQRLAVDISSIEATAGDVIKFRVSKFPTTATLQKLIYSVYPSYLGRYEPGVKGFYATQEGNGHLTISAQDDNSVSVSVPVHVKPEEKTHDASFWTTAAIVTAVVFILYAILK